MAKISKRDQKLRNELERRVFDEIADTLLSYEISEAQLIDWIHYKWLVNDARNTVKDVDPRLFPNRRHTVKHEAMEAADAEIDDATDVIKTKFLDALAVGKRLDPQFGENFLAVKRNH